MAATRAARDKGAQQTMELGDNKTKQNKTWLDGGGGGRTTSVCVRACACAREASSQRRRASLQSADPRHQANGRSLANVSSNLRGLSLNRARPQDSSRCIPVRQPGGHFWRAARKHSASPLARPATALFQVIGPPPPVVVVAVAVSLRPSRPIARSLARRWLESRGGRPSSQRRGGGAFLARAPSARACVWGARGSGRRLSERAGGPERRANKGRGLTGGSSCCCCRDSCSQITESPALCGELGARALQGESERASESREKAHCKRACSPSLIRSLSSAFARPPQERT